MHYTQNDKIRQATEGTIVVGVDIGSEKNYARAFKGVPVREESEKVGTAEDVHW